MQWHIAGFDGKIQNEIKHQWWGTKKDNGIVLVSKGS